MAPPSMPPPSPAYLAGQRAKLVSAPQAKEDGCGRCASLLAWGDAKVPPTWCGSLSRPLEAVAASSSALHHYQACVGSGLYFFLSLVRLVPVAGSLLFLLLPVPVFMPLYRRLSHNRAGGYYDTLVQQLTRLPQHQADIKRRGCCQMSDEYRIGLERERRDGIVRACNALESALVCYMIAVPFLNLFPANPLEALAYYGLHRWIGSNPFDGRYGGLFQPEAMWRLASCQRSGEAAEGRLEPLEVHPSPSI
mmetsp:Transcript_6187/g.19813  ORF Transcript_6187/g.19813 Transcript_6187/m.19813 type:complete len:250 (-) Transcript_6187:216-965(-)